ncbi:MAG TPA: acylphosphatase [Candidatus Saccharimonadales bacterium]|nr:acylphosphatase [Candidatus Saccharimonadales bacterium]
MKILHALVFGFVQGVGYRKFVKQQATKLGLTGWVRNLPEGTVEFEVCGDEDRIEDLLASCRRGPFLAQVKTIETDWQEKDFPYTEFILRHDVD